MISIVAYIPVIHAGYLNFIAKHSDVKTLYLLGEDVIADYRPLVKDIRRLAPDEVRKALASLLPDVTIVVADQTTVQELAKDTETLYLFPDEDVMHDLEQRFFKDAQVEYQSVFLRWDRSKTLQEQSLEDVAKISSAEFDRSMMETATEEAFHSPDWWRQVGGVLVKDGSIALTAYNHHLPSNQELQYHGDPRANFKKGIHIELSTAQHAEASIIATAAKKGIALEGASLYATTFPCPVCAKLIAESGVSTLYFREGYAMLDGQHLLEESGVEVVRVE